MLCTSIGQAHPWSQFEGARITSVVKESVELKSPKAEGGIMLEILVLPLSGETGVGRAEGGLGGVEGASRSTT